MAEMPLNSRRSPLEAVIAPVISPELASKVSARPGHVAVDGAGVGEGIGAAQRHAAIDMPLIHEDVAAGESDIAVDLAEVVERVPDPPRRSTARMIWPLLVRVPIEPTLSMRPPRGRRA